MEIEQKYISLTDYGYFMCINVSLNDMLINKDEKDSPLYKYKFEVEAKYKKTKNKIHVDVPLAIIMQNNYYDDLILSDNNIDEIIDK